MNFKDDDNEQYLASDMVQTLPLRPMCQITKFASLIYRENTYIENNFIYLYRE